jgi:hypothetical protein
MPELPMRYHPLAPDVKCPACGAGLTFVRVRGYGDLYQCASGGPCKREVLHYVRKETKTCGYALVNIFGPRGVWTACGETAAQGGVRAVALRQASFRP